MKALALLPAEARSTRWLPPIILAGAQGIGYSKEGRSILCLSRGQADAPLRMLILAGQHGDERPAQQTIASLLALSPVEVPRRLPGLQLAIVPAANPDGCVNQSRWNSEGIDLNRDHQFLRSDETMAIHQFVRQWQPQVILDLHSYPSRRRHLLEQNVVLDHDVFLDVPSHPAILARPGPVTAAHVLRELLGALSARSIHSDRYTIVEPSGLARHSTTDVVDARNGLALRYGAFTLLVENRQPRPEETAPERLRLGAVQECALWTILEWFSRNHDLFPRRLALEPPGPGMPVQVRFKHQHRWHGLQLACRDAAQARPVDVTCPRYRASLVPRRTVSLPRGYAVPTELAELGAVLRRHGFVSTRGAAGELASVGRLRIEEARPSNQPGRSARDLALTLHPMDLRLDRYEIFPTRQKGGEALAVFLEPESQHGLHRIPDLNIPLASASWYPVLRVLEGQPLC